MVSKSGIIGGVVLVIVAGIIALIASSLRRLSTQEAGLQYDSIQRVLKDKLYLAGLHSGPPGFRFIIFPKNYRSLAFDNIKCLNKDGLEIQLDVQFQYLAMLNGKSLKKLVMEFESHENYREVVMQTAEEVIHDTCSLFNVTQFQSERTRFQSAIRDTLHTRMTKDLSTSVRDVQVSDILRPYEYETIVRDKESAKINIKVATQERPRILTAAKTKKKEAETQANITLDIARTNARIAIAKAQAEAKAIMNAYETEAQTYKEIMTNQGLTAEGLLSYLTTRAIESASSDVNVNLDAPAKTSYSS
jgi:regulator of protease activity HflC (stomatin/prohibitin superfamily)